MVIALLFGGLFLWLAARELPFETVHETLGRYDTVELIGWLVCFCAVYSISHLARIVRWYELLRPLGHDDPRGAWRVCVIGFMAILLLPLRLGEFVRPVLVSKTSDVTASAAMGTVVVERVLDGLIITGLLFVTLSTYSAQHETTLFASSLALISAAIFVPAFGICLVSIWRKELANRVLRVCFFWAPRIGERVIEMVSSFIDGIASLRSRGALLRFMAMTAVYWAFNGLSVYVLARFAFGFDLTPWDAFTVLCILVVGIMIPAGPGMAGNFEFFVAKGMSLFTADVATVAAYAATMHILQFFVIVIPGLVILLSDKTIRRLLADAFRNHDPNVTDE